MVHDSMKNLQFDRRLRSRRGWVAPDAFETHLEQLPDVTDKGEMLGEEEPQAAALASAQPDMVAEPPAAAPAPGSGFPPSEG